MGSGGWITESVWEDRNSIVGRGNNMCKAGVAMQSVSEECVQLLYSGSIRAGAESWLEATQGCLCDSAANEGNACEFLKQGFSMILLWLEGGLELTRKLEANGGTREGARRPEPDLSLGELETYYPSCPSLNTCSTGCHLGRFLPPNRTLINVWG